MRERFHKPPYVAISHEMNQSWGGFIVDCFRPLTSACPLIWLPVVPTKTIDDGTGNNVLAWSVVEHSRISREYILHTTATTVRTTLYGTWDNIPDVGSCRKMY